MAQLSNELYTESRGNMYTFTSFPDAKIYNEENSNKWVQHLIFGDYIKIIDLEISSDRIKVKSRGIEGWININSIQKNRILEVNFIDIGQGDGCHLVTPDDKHYLIDAGKGDNMYRYLFWRFNLDVNKYLNINFKAIISHPDNDHFLGFKDIFKSGKIKFDKIYHSGVVQRPKNLGKGWNTEIGESKELSDNNKYLLSIVGTNEEVHKLLDDSQNLSGSGSQYLKTLNLSRETIQPEFITLNQEHEDLNVLDELNFKMKVLSPILKEVDGNNVLPYFKSLGKTKNGHSVLIRLEYKGLRILLGGDINEEAGEYINEQLAPNAKEELQVDVAKACHHGSHLFSYEFLENVNALSTVISSGDDESYSHPRPDTLGALGKTGYSKKPLIFSTELARSNKDFSKSSVPVLIKKYQEWEEAKNDLIEFKKNYVPSPDNIRIFEIKKQEEVKSYKEINSYLTRYGMISLRSDGEKMIMTQKLEKDSSHGKYDIYKFKFNSDEKRFVRVK